MRLNLHALIGAQRCNVDELRVCWRLQDEIDLTEAEKKKINYRVVQAGDQKMPVWDLVGNEPVEYSFSEEDYARLKKLVIEWQPGFLTTADRQWLSPLLDQFFEGSEKIQAVDKTLKRRAAN
jgi:hypothetical protein